MTLSGGRLSEKRQAPGPNRADSGAVGAAWSAPGVRSTQFQGAARRPLPPPHILCAALLRRPFRPCLKHVKQPRQRVFFRHTALMFLAIHKVLLRQIALPGEKIPRRWAQFHVSLQYTKYCCVKSPCLAKKSLAVGHSSMFQTRPRPVPAGYNHVWKVRTIL